MLILRQIVRESGQIFLWEINFSRLLLFFIFNTHHCLKSAQIQSFFWSVFFHIRTEYVTILQTITNAGKYGPEKTPYLDTFHAVHRPVPLTLWEKWNLWKLKSSWVVNIACNEKYIRKWVFTWSVCSSLQTKHWKTWKIYEREDTA